MSSIVDTRSLRFRVLLLAAVTIGMTLAVAAVSVKLLFERHIQRRIAAELETRFAEIAGSIALNQKGEIVFSRPLVDARYDEPLSGAYWQISMAGTVLERSRSLWDETLPVPDPLSPDRPREVTAEDGADLYVLARPLEIGPESAGRELTLVTALDHREIEALSDAFGTELNMALLAIAAVLFAGAFLQTDVGLAPLRRLHQAVQNVRSGERQRLDGDFPSEVLPLAEDLDRLLDRHEALLEKARARAGTLAHGFKTPLTILGLEARKLEAEGHRLSAEILREQVETMRRHVEEELARARIRGTAVSGSAVGAGTGTDLAPATRRLVDLVRRMPFSDGLRFTIDVPEGLGVRMDPHDFGEVLGNLLDNARKWASTRVTVKAARRDAGTVLLEVTDDGPGFQPASTPTSSRNGDGSGLGLKIVEQILEAYGAASSVTRHGDETVVSVELGARTVPPGRYRPEVGAGKEAAHVPEPAAGAGRQ